MSARIPTSPSDTVEPLSATDRAAHAIASALERHELLPGQPLIETELALRLGVGRNAVREAIQRLAAKGTVELSRFRSPTIRKLDIAETMEVLEVAEEMFGLLARVAARNFRAAPPAMRLKRVLQGLKDEKLSQDRGKFAALRREFYRTLLEIGGNRELERHFATIQMQIIYVQFESPALYKARVADYSAIGDAIMAGEVQKAEDRARRHVRQVRKIIRVLQSESEGGG